MYKIGDRVVVDKVNIDDEWLVKVGEKAAVVGIDDNCGRREQTEIDLLYIRTDSMVKGNWGRFRISPMHLSLDVSEDG